MHLDAWRLLHLGFLFAWAGAVAVELVIEITGADEEASRAQAARLHFWIDVLVEVPLIAAVLVTGGVLLARVWPPLPLHLVKIGAALAAIVLNLYCFVAVVLRY